MFDRIAPTYDRANHVLSLSVDRYWRRRAVDAVRDRLATVAPPWRVLDVCCGTGDLSLALSTGLGEAVEVVGADFSHGMLARAQEKNRNQGA